MSAASARSRACNWMMVEFTLPPHGLLLFVMSGLAGTPLSEIFRKVPPFIVAMLAIVAAGLIKP